MEKRKVFLFEIGVLFLVAVAYFLQWRLAAVPVPHITPTPANTLARPSQLAMPAPTLAVQPYPPALAHRNPARIDPAGAWTTADKYTFVVKCAVGLITIPPKFVLVEGGVDVNADGCEAECVLDECLINSSEKYTASRPISLHLGQKIGLWKGRTYWAVNPAHVGDH